MSILVTGGSGFIASHLINKLCKDYKVYLHNRSSRFDAIVSRDNSPTIISGPLNLDTLSNSEIDNCECIIHLAGSFSASTFEELIFDNLITTKIILDFMRIKKIPKIIFISSAAVWGKNLQEIPTEKTPASPETEYAYTKFSAECLIKSAHSNGDIETAFMLRPNTIYGIGSNAGVIHSLISQALNGTKFKIFGNGVQRRQPLNIQDMVDVIFGCLMFDNKGLNLYGVAGPEAHSILDIARKIAEIFNVKFDYEFLSAQTNKPQTILINQSRINNELSWTPKVTLDNGLIAMFNVNKFE
ncbi:MAG TPA: hypothetical protein DCW35_02980 [Polynucleobacter sp.]|nr:hypothetical protein [Polynucleobacter sp.]